MAPDDMVTLGEPTVGGPQRSPLPADTAVHAPRGADVLPLSLGAELSKLLQLALDRREDGSLWDSPRRRAAMHQVEISLTQDVHPASGLEDAALRRILSLVSESARRDAVGPEQVVHALRTIWLSVPQPATVTPDEWNLVYHRILGRCLDEFYAGA